MKPGRYNISGEKAGSRFALPVNDCDEIDGVITPVDQTGATAFFRVYRPGSTAVLLEASTAGGTITLGGTPFNIVISVDLAIKAGDYVYDLYTVKAGVKRPVLTGELLIEASA